MYTQTNVFLLNNSLLMETRHPSAAPFVSASSALFGDTYTPDKGSTNGALNNNMKEHLQQAHYNEKNISQILQRKIANQSRIVLGKD